MLALSCGDAGVGPPTAPPPPPAPVATTVTVNPGSAALSALGEMFGFTAEVRDQTEQVMTGITVAWTTSDASVAAVDAAGQVTAAANGSATITAAAGSVSGTAVVTVAQAVRAVAVWPTEHTLAAIGDTVRLVAEATDANGHVVADSELEWSSSDTTVATVDGAGLVRGNREGAVTVAAASGEARGSSSILVLSADPGDHHAALTAGLPESPFVNTTVAPGTRTIGTLRMSLAPDAFPVMISRGGMGLLVAGSRLGSGRVVAFSGQDFISSGDRSTLLGTASGDRLLANAVRWAGSSSAPRPLRALVDNERIADALERQGLEGVAVVGRRGSGRNWSKGALDDVDVAVVQTNEWGTAHLTEAFVAPLRAFVEGGGGLVVAGSALHWSWWIEAYHGALPANALLRGTGISWNKDWIDDIASASTQFDPRALRPALIWVAYLDGGPIEPDEMALLPGLFNSALDLGRTEELDVALARLVRETPALPISGASPEARLAADIAETLGPYEWPEPHPWAAAFPGLPAAGARREDGAVTVDATRVEFPADASRAERHLPLGYYAPPGALVTIEVPASHATGELRVAVGEQYGHLGAAHNVWRRPPRLRREFTVADRRTGVSNAYGGSIALIVPPDYTAAIPVAIEGAIPMALYTAGEPGEWFTRLDAGAPQAIIQKLGGIRLVISAESARGITDPDEVSAFWSEFQRHHAELAGGPVRAYESTWVFVPQVAVGGAHAGPLTINYPLDAEAWVSVPGTAAGRAWIASLPAEGPTQHVSPIPTPYSPSTHGVDWWMFGHELGHQWQTGDWGSPWAGGLYSEIGEVAVNLFTMYTLNDYVFGGGDFTLVSRPDPAVSSVNHAELFYLRWPAADIWERLSMYRQLIVEFGWPAMRRVFHSYYDPAYPRAAFGEKFDGFAIRFSAIVQRDLVSFFRHWEYPLSDTAAATIRSFGFEEWLPPGW